MGSALIAGVRTGLVGNIKELEHEEKYSHVVRELCPPSQKCTFHKDTGPS